MRRRAGIEGGRGASLSDVLQRLKKPSTQKAIFSTLAGFFSTSTTLFACDPCIYGALRANEARVGIEPTHRAFAEPGLTTWLPRR